MWFFKSKKKKLEEKKRVEEEKKSEEERLAKTKAEQEAREQVEQRAKEEDGGKAKSASKDSAKKSSASKEGKPAEQKTRKALYRVLYDKEARMWVIKKDGAKRIIASFATKEETLARVKELSTSKELSFVVHKKDGKFQKK